MLTADLRREYARTHVCALTAANLGTTIEAIYRELEDEAAAWLRSTNFSDSRLWFERAADLRYVGQEHSVTMPLRIDFGAADAEAQIKAAFDTRHLQRYGHNALEERAEIVAVRVSIVGVLEKPAQTKIAAGNGTPAADARVDERSVRFDDGPAVRTIVYERSRLVAGDRFAGPAIVEESGSLTAIPPGASGHVNEFGHLLIEVEAQ